MRLAITLPMVRRVVRRALPECIRIHMEQFFEATLDVFPNSFIYFNPVPLT